MTANVSHYKPIVTIEQHIIEGQQRYPGATGEFSWLLSGITLATKIIQDRVRQAGLLDVLGPTGASNVQGEMIQKLDVIANETLMQCLGYRGNVGMMISEEDAEPRIVQDVGEAGRYVVLFDPLDGSSNIDVNVPIGTIFSILRRKPDVDRSDAMPHILQSGIQQVAAGYVLYGSSTVMVYTAGDGVHIFTLDPAIGAYVLTQENVQMPENGRTYSVNEAYALTFPRGVQKYLAWAKSEEAGGYSLRYVGSLVSDFHRTLLRGGVFLYPPTQKDRLGKLRLLYEANPIAFLAEQAGGVASDGRQRVLEKQPQSIHERTPLIVGSRDETKRVLSFWGA